VIRPSACGDVRGLCEGVRRRVERCGAELVLCDVGRIRNPDLGTVEALARLQLTARRLGRRMRFRGACGALRDLLALLGLESIVRCSDRLVEPGRQAEQREPPLGVQEEADPTDPVA
jgi:STAS domain